MDKTFLDMSHVDVDTICERLIQSGQFYEWFPFQQNPNTQQYIMSFANSRSLGSLQECFLALAKCEQDLIAEEIRSLKDDLRYRVEINEDYMQFIYTLYNMHYAIEAQQIEKGNVFVEPLDHGRRIKKARNLILDIYERNGNLSEKEAHNIILEYFPVKVHVSSALRLV